MWFNFIRNETIQDSDSEIELEDDDDFQTKKAGSLPGEASDEEIELEEEELLGIKKEKSSDETPGSHTKTYDCKLCDLKATTSKGLRTHIEAKHKKIQYLCDDCDFRTPYKQYLKSHFEVKHSGVKKYTCSKCDFKSFYRLSLMQHEKREHSERSEAEQGKPKRKRGRKRAYSRKYKFEEVKEGQEDERKELGPGEAAHTPDEAGIVWCQFARCDFSSRYCLNVSRHEQAEHMGVRYKCDDCDFRAKQRGTVLMHANSVHKGIVHKCEACDFKTPWKSYLRRHLLEKHGVTNDGKKRGAPQPYSKRRGRRKQHACDLCKRKYASGKGFRMHLRRMHGDVTEKPLLQCDKCDFKSRKEEQLNHHIMRVHEGLKYSCEICGYISSYEKHVKKHSLTHHIEQKPQIKLVKTEDQGLECGKCGATFTTSSLLNKHLQGEHSDTPGLAQAVEKKLRKCPDCDYSPSTNRALQVHIKTKNKQNDHTTHKCALCDHVNCLQRGLLRHRFVKHGRIPKRVKMEAEEQKHGKSYSCQLCDNQFKFKQTLFIHQRDSHDKTDFLSCPDCNFLHTSDTKLKLHRNNRFVCKSCEFKTCSKYDLRNHSSKVHGRNTKSGFKFIKNGRKRKLTSSGDVRRDQFMVKEEPISPTETSRQADIEAFKSDVRTILQPSKVNTIEKPELTRGDLHDPSPSPSAVLVMMDHDYLGVSHSHSRPGENEEVAAAVGFLRSLENAEKMKPGQVVVKTDNRKKRKRNCDFGCDVTFASEEDFYIHITDYHNNF